MNIIQSDNVNVFVNGSGILAEIASLSTSVNLTPIHILNRKGSVNQSIGGPLSSKFSFTYPVELNNEPNFLQVKYLKTGFNNFNFDGSIVSIGGITGSCYLDSYSFRINPNEIIKSTVEYTSYVPLTGFLQKKQTYNYDLQLNSGLAHALTTLIINGDTTQVVNYGISYDFKANWQPIYSVGNIYPTQINLLGGEENLSVIRDYYTGLSVSGQSLTGNIGSYGAGGNLITINELAFAYNLVANFPIYIDMSGAQVNNVKVDVNLNDIIRVTNTATKYF